MQTLVVLNSDVDQSTLKDHNMGKRTPICVILSLLESLENLASCGKISEMIHCDSIPLVYQNGVVNKIELASRGMALDLLLGQLLVSCLGTSILSHYGIYN
ncbi:unnamed protein product [Sphenostylis stenocarpa]|uniref:Uncharacterized protein n=1 Tax=Sphenostylis stenocarpa TaxID=92480 RepID=A0AA86S2N5_9FABA|nr:unnamed protein product [Sphenostylis stenocarpa]